MNAAFLLPELPSATDALAIETVGAVSSLVIVPVADAVPRVAPDGLVSETVNVSFGSTTASPATATLTVCEVTPGANVRVPDVAV